jgi:hypothetical protein
VETKGVEPSSLGCKPRTLPLSYVPEVAPSKGIEPSLAGRQPARITSSSRGQSSHPLESNQILRGFGPARRPLTQEREMGVFGTPRRRDFSCQRSAATVGAAHPGRSRRACCERCSFSSGPGTRTPICWCRASRPAVGPIPIVVLRTHLSRREGRRTRTLVQAVYGRGSQPWRAPGKRKNRPRFPWGGFRSVYRWTATWPPRWYPRSDPDSPRRDNRRKPEPGW